MTTRRRFVVGGLSLAGALGTSRFGERAMAADATPEAPCPAPDATELDALIRAWNTAFETGDEAFFRAHTSPNYVYHPGGLYGGPNESGGLDTLLEVVKARHSGFSANTGRIDFTVVQGAWVAARIAVAGTHSGTFYGNEPTGKATEFQLITVLRTACGIIEESWGFWDGGELLDQIEAIDLPGLDPADTPATPEAFVEGVCAPVTPEESIATSQEYWDVVWGADLTDVAQLDGVTALYVREHLPYGGELVGQEALIRHVKRWKTAMPDLVITPNVIFSDGIHSVTLWTATGTPTGDLLGLAPPTNPQQLSWGGCDIHWTNCGRVDEVWTEFDMHDIVIAYDR